MPPGIPVATVSIDGAKNAALLAVQILGISTESIQKKLVDYKKKMETESMGKNKNLNPG
jgi:5-(carboxyamino)imidazole ribonucleotide mutase